MSYVESRSQPERTSLADVARCSAGEEPLFFCQFLDDFSRAIDKATLIDEEPQWGRDPGRWVYDLAAAAHKLADDNALAVPSWVMKDCYTASRPYYAFDTKNEEFQAYLRQTTPIEYRWHNLFLGENVLRRA